MKTNYPIYQEDSLPCALRGMCELCDARTYQVQLRERGAVGITIRALLRLPSSAVIAHAQSSLPYRQIPSYYAIELLSSYEPM
jgi:hypothetical protein